MSSLLVVDDDPGFIVMLADMLRFGGHDVTTAQCGREAIAHVMASAPDVAFVDLQMNDLSGLEVMRQIREIAVRTFCVMVTGFATVQIATEAFRLGAIDFLEKPVSEETLSAVLTRLIGSVPTADVPLTAYERHSIGRWADAVVRVIDASADPRTLTAWGHSIGVSYGALRNWCATARLSPRYSLAFARVLRAVIRCSMSKTVKAEELLNVVDLRTLRKLLTLGNPGRQMTEALPVSVDDFISQQKWIQGVHALEEVRVRVVERIARHTDSISKSDKYQLNRGI